MEHPQRDLPLPFSLVPLMLAFAILLPTRLIMRKSLIQHLEQRGVRVRPAHHPLSSQRAPGTAFQSQLCY